MIDIPSLDPCTDILDTDKIMITHQNGTTETINGTNFNKRTQIISASSKTITGTPLKTGDVVRVFFTADITGSDTTTALSLTYNGTNYNVKVAKNGSLVNFVAYNMGGTPAVYKYCQAYTELELLYDGTQFIIVGNPVVISSNTFLKYANELTIKDIIDNNLYNLVTSSAIYNHVGDRVITVPATLANDADLDDITVSNRIKMYTAAYSVSRLNTPSGWNGGLLLSYKAATFGFQIAFNYTDSEIHFRNYYSSQGWKSWKKISVV